MKCEDCELLLAQGEAAAAVEEHLSACAGCRAIAEELRANAAVLEALRDEELPRIEVKLPRTRSVYPWAVAAAAAALVIGSLLPRPAPPMPPPPPPEPPAATTVPRAQPLKIKMLTPDPEVVIYWIVD